MTDTLAEALTSITPSSNVLTPDTLPNLDFESVFANTSAAKDETPRLCGEPGCTNEVVKGARGPAPKFCPEHKPATRAKSATATNRRGWANGANVEKNLVASVEVMAGALLFLPHGSPLYLDGSALYASGPKIVHELVVLAEEDKRLRATLEKLAAPGKFGPLVLACGSLILTVTANHGLLPGVLNTLVSDLSSGGDS